MLRDQRVLYEKATDNGESHYVIVARTVEDKDVKKKRPSTVVVERKGGKDFIVPFDMRDRAKEIYVMRWASKDALLRCSMFGGGSR
jgi:hypothetical protein